LPFDDREWQKNISAEYGDRFWREYRATPKAYVSLAQGEKLWGSRFGKRTSIQFFSTDEKIIEQFRSKLLAKLQPAAGGFVFEPVRAQALEASVGGTPFGLLFLGFSFFLILSALMLVGLLYRLNLDRRAQQTGVFFAEGFAAAVVRWLFLGEGLILAILGVLLGCGAAVLYSWALVQFLAAIWPGGALSSLLEPHWTLLSLSSGAVGALVVSVLTILWVVRAFGRVSPRALLAGQLDDSGTAHRPASWLSWVIVIGCVLLAVALLLIGPSLPGHEAKAGTFFGSGALFLTAGLTASLAWLKRPGKNLTQGNGFWSIARLGVGNAGRYPARSLLIVGLLASAAFMLVAVESFRRQAKAGDGSKNAADGGFALIAETDLPVIRDLNSEAGRAELLKKLPEGEQQPAKALLEQTTIIALRAKAGDDVSCLNLYKPRTPRVLGVPKSLIDRGGFVFDAAINRENPWQSLTQEAQQIPAFGESNTLIWMLKTGMGGIVEVPDGKGEPQPLKISGMMHDSVFQSSLLIAEERFLQLYPNHEGSNYFLIAAPKEHIEAVRDLLRKSLADRGVEIAKTKDKLASYLAVENTYLSTFQALGGLGLLLGSLGLAVVLLRAVWERRAELALFRALGYSRGQLVWLVLVENGFLLLLGLSLGTIAALLSILPQLFSGAGAVPVMNLLMLYGGVIVVGLVTGLLAITGALQTPIVPALRRE
jgi:ABC-type antimicrobial peptide transport system permease subunit